MSARSSAEAEKLGMNLLIIYRFSFVRRKNRQRLLFIHPRQKRLPRTNFGERAADKEDHLYRAGSPRRSRRE